MLKCLSEINSLWIRFYFITKFIVFKAISTPRVETKKFEIDMWKCGTSKLYHFCCEWNVSEHRTLTKVHSHKVNWCINRHYSGASLTLLLHRCVEVIKITFYELSAFSIFDLFRYFWKWKSRSLSRWTHFMVPGLTRSSLNRALLIMRTLFIKDL